MVAVGDADNDVPLLLAAGLGVAVANAEPDLKAVADVVTGGSSADGVVELVDLLLSEEGRLATR